MANSSQRQDRGQDGIALIAVLSFLGILLVLGIALVATMRVERMASEAGKANVQTTVFLKGCVYAAIEDLNYAMWGVATNIRVSEAMAVIVSKSGASSLGSGTGLVDGDARDWIHEKFLVPPNTNYDVVLKASQANWVNVPDPVSVNGKKPLLGRFAYVAMESSGAYDANLIATGGTRRLGLSIGEVNSLTDIVTAASFRQNRNYYQRFATPGEIVELNDGSPPASEVYAVDGSLFNDLVPYSLCYDEGWYDWSAAPGTWHLDGAFGAPRDVRTWGKADAQAVFQGLGYTDPADMAQCFMDYVDADFRPGATAPTAPNVGVPSGEAIPMINEIAASNKLQIIGGAGASSLVHTLRFEVETWYPFPGNTNNNNYRVQVNALSSTFSPALLNPAIGLPALSAAFTCDPANPYRVFTFDFVSPPMDVVTGMPLGSLINGGGVRGYNVSIVDLSDGGATIDQFVAPATVPYDLRLPPLSFSGTFPTGSPAPVSIQVNDPRLNHDASQWSKVPSTLGNNNDGLTNFGVSSSTLTSEGLDMYVRNSSSNLQSVAELGFLSTSSRWSTIDLFSPRGRDLLRMFRTDSFTARHYTNGPVNPNTLNSNVLLAAFNAAPIERFPGEDPPAGTAAAQLINPLTHAMVTYSSSNSVFGSNQFDSAAGWVTLPVFTDGTLTNNNNQKESLIRNSYRLFNPNQNLFTIIVIAQTINDVDQDGAYSPSSSGGQDEITGEKRAVAMVWRDPFPNTLGSHETLVRLFRYLDE